MWDIDTPFEKDIQFVSGDDWSIPIVLPQPVSGLTFQAYISTPSGQVAMGAQDAGNVVSLSLANAVTAMILAGVYPWQFSFTDHGGLKTTLFQGNATVIANA